MSKYLFHAVFLSSISFLIFKKFNQIKVKYEHRFALGQVVSVHEMARPVFLKDQKSLIFEVKKNADAYKHPINETYRNRAIETGKQLLQIDNYIGQTAKNGTESVEKLTIFKDSLLRMVDNEEYTKELMGPVLQHQQHDLANFYVKLNGLETGFLNELARLESWLHTNNCYNYIVKKIGWGGCGFDAFEPAFMPTCLNPIVGQKAEAEVVLTGYLSRHDQNIKIFLNGQPLDVEFGKAHFTQKFTDLGLQKMIIRGEQRFFEVDEEGEEIEPKWVVVEKEFYINVPELH